MLCGVEVTFLLVPASSHLASQEIFLLLKPSYSHPYFVASMSGLEILGIATSAIRVAQIVTDLVKIFNRIRDTPLVAQNRLQQLHTLVELSKLIESSQQLQTAEVDAILQDCLKNAEQIKTWLQGLGLEKGKSRFKTWIKTVGGMVNEERVIGMLGSLEASKTSLVLCIAQIDS